MSPVQHLPSNPYPSPSPILTACIPASLSASVFTHTFKVRGLSNLIPRGRSTCQGGHGQAPQSLTPPSPPRSSQLWDRRCILRVHGHSGRPGQDGPAGGLGGVRRAQGVSPTTSLNLEQVEMPLKLNLMYICVCVFLFSSPALRGESDRPAPAREPRGGFGRKQDGSRR